MAKKTEIKDQSIDELNIRSRELSEEIFQLMNELKVNRKLEKPHLLRLKKRERARVLTTLRVKSATEQTKRA